MKPIACLQRMLTPIAFGLSSLLASAQQDSSTVVQSHLSSGISLNYGGQFWKQKNLNAILSGNNVTEAGNLSVMFGFEWFRRRNRLEYGIESQLQSRAKKGSADVTRQRFGGGIINLRLHLTDKRNTFYPITGIGLIAGNTEIKRRNGPNTLAAALSNRNTTSLFNRQGLAVIGFGGRFFPEKNNAFIAVEGGYRLGFSATNWSTDGESSNYMVNSTTDNIRQWYLKIAMGFERKRR